MSAARRPLHVSVSWSSPFARQPGATARGSDWQLRGWRRARHHLREAWRIHRRADDILLVTGAMEVYFLCVFSLLRPGRRLVIYDFLRPRSKWGVAVGRILLWRVDRWLVIREADVVMLRRRFGVRADRCVFVPFPGRSSADATVLGDYVYAAGIAHRDWETLVEAARHVGARFVVSSHPRLVDVPANIDARDLVSPEEGRDLSARARIVVVPLRDTELPSGPVVVVDAQANGKAVVASDVGGTRDYIEDGLTGWLVPPGDPDALAAKLQALLDDTMLLESVGAAAQARVAGVQECWELMLVAADR